MNLEPHARTPAELADLFSHAVDLVTPDVPVLESAALVQQRILSLFSEPLTLMQVVSLYRRGWSALPVGAVRAHLDQLRVDGFLTVVVGINTATRWARTR